MTAVVFEDLDWMDDALDVIGKLAERGTPFDAYDLTLEGLREAPHPNNYGALFSKAQAAGIIAHCGWHKSARRSRNGGVCSLWIGKGHGCTA